MKHLLVLLTISGPLLWVGSAWAPYQPGSLPPYQPSGEPPRVYGYISLEDPTEGHRFHLTLNPSHFYPMVTTLSVIFRSPTGAEHAVQVQTGIPADPQQIIATSLNGEQLPEPVARTGENRLAFVDEDGNPIQQSAESLEEIAQGVQYPGTRRALRYDILFYQSSTYGQPAVISTSNPLNLSILFELVTGAPYQPGDAQYLPPVITYNAQGWSFDRVEPGDLMIIFAGGEMPVPLSPKSPPIPNFPNIQ